MARSKSQRKSWLKFFATRVIQRQRHRKRAWVRRGLLGLVERLEDRMLLASDFSYDQSAALFGFSGRLKVNDALTDRKSVV